MRTPFGLGKSRVPTAGGTGRPANLGWILEKQTPCWQGI